MTIERRKLNHQDPRVFLAGFALSLLAAARLFAPLGAVHAKSQAATQAAVLQAVPPEQEAFFKQKIQPILINHCLECHSTETRSAGGLRLDEGDAVLTGGKSGPAVVPGKPDDSLLVQRVQATELKRRMPKGEDDPLPPEDIANLKTWIQQGAYFPAGKLPANASAAAPQVGSAPAHAQAVAYPRPATADQLAYFEKNVRPILVNRCYNCHSDAFKDAGGLRVDTGVDIFKGGNDGPVIVPGHPEKSLLLDRVKSRDAKKRMPQESAEALSPEEIATLETWIKNGAAWPDETEKLPPTPARLAALYPKLREKHWSWQPLTDPVLPSGTANGWAESKIDRLVLAKLDEKKLAPVQDADPATLLRRVHYDLTGLPPTPVELRAFDKHHAPEDYARVVDELLASPQYGERWGRHWLDVARYAESSGPSRNMPYPNAWRYRDYVIDAYNRDLPYDRFLKEQIAGDLLPAATPADRDRLLIATGYLALGPKDVNQRFKARFKMDNVDDQIDTVTRSTMALTVSCARCHDHKFDPIPTTDYYALAGIFTSTEDDSGLGSKMGGGSLDYYEPKHLGLLSTAANVKLATPEELAKLKGERDEAKKKFDAIREKAEAEAKANPGHPPVLSKEEKAQRLEITRAFIQARENYTLAADPGEHGYGIHCVREGTVADTAVRIRGVEEKHGPTVPRGFLTVVNLPNTPKIAPDHSGRLELAEWIAREDNPLTARVYVNRVWEHLFGTGIVSSVDNFGTTGDTPSNLELLNYLALDFTRNGWSTKKLVREIVLSHAYRLGSDFPPAYKDVDPGNRYVWRHAPRRLAAEEIRDSILASSGQLNLSHPHGSPAMALRMIEIRDDGPVVGSVLSAADRSRYRSIYLPLLRDETPRALEAFDPVSQTLVTGKREETTVPSQALFMLNSPFVRQQSLLLADKLLRSQHANDRERIGQAYLLVAGIDPTPADVLRVRVFLARYAASWARQHPQSTRPAPKAHLALASSDAGPITAGIVREDGLAQDDDSDKPTDFKDPSGGIAPDSAKEAAWSAFVQALYGSAAFQFVR